MDLTEDQWNVVSAILPEDPVRPDRRGRPWSDRREVPNGVLWILRTGAPWKDLPDRYGAYQTAHRQFQNWVRSGIMERVLVAIAQDLKDRGGLDLRECFIDGTFVPARKRAPCWEDQAGEGLQDHGDCRLPWSPCRRMHNECYPG